MDNKWVWIDCEMTGLDPVHDRIIEIGSIVTDDNLNIIAESPAIVIHQSDLILSAMDEWNVTHHSASGLIKEVKTSLHDEESAEEKMLLFLKQYVGKGKSPMCGSSICQDRRFIYKYMPKLAAYFHYRNLDVSSLKILAHAWKPGIVEHVSGNIAHRVLEDVKASINELKLYRDKWLLNESIGKHT